MHQHRDRRQLLDSGIVLDLLYPISTMQKNDDDNDDDG